jgi:protocatechuate 3,4-dioxygenase beta subunit
MVSAAGYKPLITQLYPRDDQWVSNDTVFAVKDDNVTLASSGTNSGRLDGIPRLPNVFDEQSRL